MRMPRWAGEFLRNIIAGLLLMGVPAMVGFLAWVQYMPWFLAVLAAIAAFGLVLFAKNQYSLYKNGRTKRISKLSDKEIERMIREWIDMPGFVFERKPQEPDVLFNFLVQDKAGRKINIFRQADTPNIIFIVGRVQTVPPNRSLADAEWRKLAGNISIEMARLGIEYAFDGEPNRYEYVRLLDPVILDDSLTDFFFKQRIFFLLRAFVLVMEICRQDLRELGPRT